MREHLGDIRACLCADPAKDERRLTPHVGVRRVVQSVVNPIERAFGIYAFGRERVGRDDANVVAFIAKRGQQCLDDPR